MRTWQTELPMQIPIQTAYIDRCLRGRRWSGLLDHAVMIARGSVSFRYDFDGDFDCDPAISSSSHR